MIIRKFGGTSIASAQRMKAVSEIINDNQNQIIVLSAISGITNKLDTIAKHLYKQEYKLATAQIDLMTIFYKDFSSDLLKDKKLLEEAYNFLDNRNTYLKSFTNKMFNLLQEKALLADGEIVSSTLFQYYLQEQSINSEAISALSFMRIDKNLEPDEFYIEENLKRTIADGNNSKVIITQGYICRNAYGEVDNLKRGGSDYSATLIGAALKADEIQIWTDIDGIHNNDPREVSITQPIKYISFDEAAELAYFGAKILHPASLQPALHSHIKVALKNTMKPELPGTIISSEKAEEGIKAVAAKENISSIRIKSGRMLNAYGFLRKVFEVFEVYKTSIDMITTSEVAISVTIDDDTYLNEIIQDLRHFCEVEFEKDQTIIAVVGIMKTNKKGYAARVFKALKDIPLKMISYGASDYNISLLIGASEKKQALNSLHSEFFISE